ncbi:MAG: hypothetical protein AB7P56_03860 [Nitrososphaeraceae archaeon]
MVRSPTLKDRMSRLYSILFERINDSRIASRTIGVPVIGIEFYIGKYDMLTKVLQGIIVTISGYLIYRIITFNESRTQEETLKRKI